MNLKEGTRRLALLLGVVGAILGGFVSYLQLQSNLEQSAPGAWSYLLIAVSPVLGFFIPWGAVRCIGWVVEGFIAAPSSTKSALVTNEGNLGQTKKKVRSLVSRNAWIIISVISLIIALSNTSKSGAGGPGESIPFLVGGFIGGLLLLGGGWALVMLAFRWISRKLPN